MGERQKEWVKLGSGIELMRYQPTWDWQKSQQKNLDEIQPGDLLSIKITEPERYLVAVDTAVKPKSLTSDNAKPVILVARVDWVYKYPTAYTIQCVCCDTERMKWYTAELTLGYITAQPSLKFKALLTPPAKPPANDMETALKKCIEGLKSNHLT